MSAVSRVCLVAGASSGIGAAIAHALGAQGFAVALGARREDRLQEVADEVAKRGGRALVRSLDVTQSASIDAFFDAAEAAFGPVDVAVSNAGVCVPGLLHEVKPDDLEIELATNLLGPLLVARRAVESMRAGGRGGDIVFVSSENAVRPRPFQTGYTATKAGVEGAARALRMELEGTGIRATIVRPGATESEFGRSWEPALIERILRSWKHWGVQRHLNLMPAESVARAVVAAITAPPGTHLDTIQLVPEGPRET